MKTLLERKHKMKKPNFREALDLIAEAIKILVAVDAAIKIYRFFRPKKCTCDCKCKKAMLG